MTIIQDIHQGDLAWVTLDPVAGHEQRGRRPVLVISNDGFYFRTHLVKVLAITSKIKRFPLNVNLPTNLPISGQVLVEHERTIDPFSPARNFEVVGRIDLMTLKQVAKINEAIHQVADADFYQ